MSSLFFGRLVGLTTEYAEEVKQRKREEARVRAATDIDTGGRFARTFSVVPLAIQMLLALAMVTLSCMLAWALGSDIKVSQIEGIFTIVCMAGGMLWLIIVLAICFYLNVMRVGTATCPRCGWKVDFLLTDAGLWLRCQDCDAVWPASPK